MCTLKKKFFTKWILNKKNKSKNLQSDNLRSSSLIHTRYILKIPVNTNYNFLEESIKLHAEGGGHITTLNTEMLMRALKNDTLKKAIFNSKLIIPDSIGIVFGLFLQGISTTRTPGIEIAEELLNHAEKNSWKVVLIGGTPKVLALLKQNLHKQFPNLNLIFTLDGYQKESLWQKLENDLLDIEPDLVLIALGTPDQEIMAMKGSKLFKGLWIGVGGAFDIWAGTKNRAPKIVRMLWAEWLYRLVTEPSRWRRVLVLPSFAWAIIKSR